MSAEFTICAKCDAPVYKGQWPAGFCGGDPAQHARPTGTFIRGNAQSFRPVVYFENARGEKKYPGRSTDPTPPGYERRELTTTHDVRKFQRNMDFEARLERELYDTVNEQRIKERKRIRRERMFEKLNKMGASQAGMDLAKKACERSDARPTKGYSPGSYITAFENDASNVRAQSLETK